MVVRSIINNMRGTRWDIIKQDDGTYTTRYSELYAGMWRLLFEDTGYTQDGIEEEFDIVLA